jgi:hypothetical protein
VKLPCRLAAGRARARREARAVPWLFAARASSNYNRWGLEVGMRATVFGLVGALACVTAIDLHAQNTLTFFASVVDEKGVPVGTLTPEDLKVAENGVEGKIVKIEPIDWPVKVQLLIDNGTGMEQGLVQIRNGVKGFVEALPDGIEMSPPRLSPASSSVRPWTNRPSSRVPTALRQIPARRASSRR